jgi:hypothetical protein
MKVLSEMPDDARVWIYQANRNLSVVENAQIRDSVAGFLDEWTSHGKSMDASFEILMNRLVVIAVDEKQALASGCGIDKSVNYMKSLGAEMNIDFFVRTQVLYKVGEEVMEMPLHVFWASKKAGKILDETIVIDTTVKNLGEVRSKLEVPFKDSWHAEMWHR